MFCFVCLQVVTLPLLPPEYRKLYSEAHPRADALSGGPPAALVVAVNIYPPRGQPHHPGEDFFRPTLTTGASRPDQGRSGISHRRARGPQGAQHTVFNERGRTAQNYSATERDHPWAPGRTGRRQTWWRYAVTAAAILSWIYYSESDLRRGISLQESVGQIHSGGASTADPRCPSATGGLCSEQNATEA